LSKEWIKLGEELIYILECPECNNIIFVPVKISHQNNLEKYPDISKSVSYRCPKCNIELLLPFVR